MGVLLILAVAPCILLETLLRIVPSEFPLYPSNSASLCFPDLCLLQQLQFLRHSMTNFLTIKDISIPRAVSVLLTTLRGLHFFTLIVNIFK